MPDRLPSCLGGYQRGGGIPDLKGKMRQTGASQARAVGVGTAFSKDMESSRERDGNSGGADTQKGHKGWQEGLKILTSGHVALLSTGAGSGLAGCLS